MNAFLICFMRKFGLRVKLVQIFQKYAEILIMSPNKEGIINVAKLKAYAFAFQEIQSPRGP